MTAKEKAEELVNKMFEAKVAIECALIAVDEIIKTFDCTTPQSIEYWEQVKQEIINL